MSADAEPFPVGHDRAFLEARAHFYAGLKSLQAEDWGRAEIELRRSLEYVPNRVSVLTNLSAALLKQGKHQEAQAVAHGAIALEPRNAEALMNLALSFSAEGHPEEALDWAMRAADAAPQDPAAWSSYGDALHDCGRSEAALECFRKAISFRPDYPQAWIGAANALRSSGRLSEAVEGYNRAISLEPTLAEAWSGKGNALEELRQSEDAAACHEKAIFLKPQYAEAHWNRALFLLRLGDYHSGWAEYEWRWRIHSGGPTRRQIRQPLWVNDQSRQECTILLHAEQGLGDTLQFCRYVPMVQQRMSRVVLEVQAPLVPLLQSQFKDVAVISAGNELPAFDCHRPLLSLPLSFGTTIETIPARRHYLHADPGRVDVWRTRLGPGTSPRVGVVWSGSRTHRNDRNRSIPLSLFKALLSGPYEYISLQKEVDREDINELSRLGTRIRSYGEELRDFADTAALCEVLDLVVTVDTSVAHLAGALGKPTWILLPYYADFRWLWDRTDSPWYAALRLFRQSRAGDWVQLLAQVREELAQGIGARK